MLRHCAYKEEDWIPTVIKTNGEKAASVWIMPRKHMNLMMVGVVGKMRWESTEVQRTAGEQCVKDVSRNIIVPAAQRPQPVDGENSMT
jgi:hypothetical protein